MERLFEKRLSGETVYDGRIIRVERDIVGLPNGGRSVREIVRHGGGVCVAALDEQNNVFMVRQFRYAFGRVLDELPAGKLEHGEDPDPAALRELEEETGYTADRMEKLAVSYPSPGYTAEQLHLYLARGLRFVGQHLDADEFLNVYRLPLDEAVRRVESGDICDAKSQTLLLLAARRVAGEARQ